MGGRGSGSPGGAAFLTPSQLEELPYNVIGFDDARGGAVYPFLEETGRAWRILTRPVGAAGEGVSHPAHTFGRAAPTLRWVNGDQVSDLYVDGLDTEAFLAETGLVLDLHKGGFVLSKRLSRLMRPHFVSGFFDADDVAVSYLDQTPDEAKVWDGAGLISRRMLRRMVLAEDLAPAKRARLEAELRHAQRVEFTVMTDRGQDKGHAIVADDLRDDENRPVDFLLPRDTKGAVRLSAPEGGTPRTFVGLSIVHGHNDMRLDIQSLINLHPFFDERQLLGWLRDEGELFARSVESGEIAEVMGRIDPHATLEDVQRWPLREYLASGGPPMWFRSHVRSLMNQHLRRLNHSTLEKLRLPIPGGRHYVMPVAVGRRAGIRGLAVGRGEVQIDPARATAWVNDEDWLALGDSPERPGSPEGIAGILGGADNDDALWLHPFTDHDGTRRILAWRSPNQLGEYVLLRPTADSHDLPWATADGEALTYPAADSRRLPARIDFSDPDYLGLVEREPAGFPGGAPAYTVAAMDEAIDRAVANQGALGMYCNALMLNKALFDRLPDQPPAPLEDIIDSAVKTGADLSRVVAWNYANSRAILKQKSPIPALLHQRLSIDWADREQRPPAPRYSSDHWLDRLCAGVRAHIADMEARRDELAARARPPEVLFEAMASDPDAVRLGAGLNQAYAAALKLRKKGPYSSVLERAKAAAEDYLAHFPPARRKEILRGALVSVYSGEESASDAVTWLAGRKEEEPAGSIEFGKTSIASLTIASLREQGMLDEIVATKEGLIRFLQIV